MIAAWGDILSASLKNIYLGIASIVPTLLGAIALVAIGWIIGSIFFKLVENLFKFAKIDNALKAAGFDKVVERTGMSLDSGYFFGKLVEWFFVVAFLVAAFDVLGLTQITTFLGTVVLGYLPNVIVAAVIILIAAIVAETAQKIVVGSAKAAGVKSVNLAGTIAKWAIWIFAILVAITQLGIAVSFIQTLYTGVIIALALALGLSFGLGGQDAAARYIEKVRGDVSDR